MSHFKKFAFLALCSMFVMFSHIATIHAQTSIAVVDIDELQQKAKVANDIREQIEKRRKSFRETVKKEEDALRLSQKRIEEQRKDLTKEEFVTMVENFESEHLKARDSIRQRRSALDNAYNVAMKTITNRIFDICKNIAAQQSIDLVMTRQNIIVNSNSLDITPQVLQELDASLPKLKLEVK